MAMRKVNSSFYISYFRTVRGDVDRFASDIGPIDRSIEIRGWRRRKRAAASVSCVRQIPSYSTRDVSDINLSLLRFRSIKHFVS